MFSHNERHACKLCCRDTTSCPKKVVAPLFPMAPIEEGNGRYQLRRRSWWLVWPRGGLVWFGAGLPDCMTKAKIKNTTFNMDVQTVRDCTASLVCCSCMWQPYWNHYGRSPHKIQDGASNTRTVRDRRRSRFLFVLTFHSFFLSQTRQHSGSDFHFVWQQCCAFLHFEDARGQRMSAEDPLGAMRVKSGSISSVCAPTHSTLLHSASCSSSSTFYEGRATTDYYSQADSIVSGGPSWLPPCQLEWGRHIIAESKETP
jgi:hypothetical protein